MGCTERAAGPGQASAASANPAATDARFDAWLGQWEGVEGTSLRLAGGEGSYVVTIRNLDGPRSFQGSAVGDGIAFERDGSKEVIRATNGVDTGMKWLAEKTNCLAVRPGEGWDRHERSSPRLMLGRHTLPKVSFWLLPDAGCSFGRGAPFRSRTCGCPLGGLPSGVHILVADGASMAKVRCQEPVRG